MAEDRKSSNSLCISLLQQRRPENIRLCAMHMNWTIASGWQTIIHSDFDPFAPLPEAESVKETTN